MGDLVAHANSASEEFGCNYGLYSSACEDICVEHEFYASSGTEKTVKAMPLENLSIFPTDQNVGLMVQELGITLNGILHIHDPCEALVHNLSLNSNNDGICQQKEMQSAVDANMLSDMIRDATDLCSNVVKSSLDVPSTIVHIDNLLKAENPTYECSISLPTTPKLVSAMKGCRAQQGAPLKIKLSVKWSPDVYDPPVTSESHTVKGYRLRPKAKKDQYKNKHSKSKSSRGSSGGDKKHAHRKSNSSLVDPRILRLRAHSDRSQLIRSQGANFGSSCHMEPLPQVHLSVAEAS